MMMWCLLWQVAAPDEIAQQEEDLNKSAVGNKGDNNSRMHLWLFQKLISIEKMFRIIPCTGHTFHIYSLQTITFCCYYFVRSWFFESLWVFSNCIIIYLSYIMGNFQERWALLHHRGKHFFVKLSICIEPSFSTPTKISHHYMIILLHDEVPQRRPLIPSTTYF